ncbi:hypothetical protein SETIT_3G169700v2 [Setaria italica]|uniref:F-box domain-containing protein n=1 Tax=Setaria italica TaxID=4555 RepID=A0A368QFV4_SETIT|nr:hypothetical protein SETIT_3G169700v2 [Setaria italica]
MQSGRHLRLHRRRRRHHHHQGMDKKPGAASLPDDLIAEILSRVPYKSLCCFKCVSRPWLALCSDPGVRRSLHFHQTLRQRVGQRPAHCRPQLSFLPPGHRDATIYDSCNGLLLCRFKDVPTQVGSRYFVGNPATEKWIDLPDTEPMKRRYPVIRLGFDPAVSSHVRVFPLVHDGDICHRQDRVTGLEIYSSGTGGWTYTPSEWGDGIRVFGNSRSAFFNSTLHLTTLDNSVIAVDTDGKTWRKILTPCNFDTIGLSQGRV